MHSYTVLTNLTIKFHSIFKFNCIPALKSCYTIITFDLILLLCYIESDLAFAYVCRISCICSSSKDIVYPSFYNVLEEYWYECLLYE